MLVGFTCGMTLQAPASIAVEVVMQGEDLGPDLFEPLADERTDHLRTWATRTRAPGS